ncbi:MAG: hypothetical protein FWG91_05775 [Lachnospiraceae bacterium]|nr:hypothetical protein [Lachnospiraceae bacterium]
MGQIYIEDYVVSFLKQKKSEAYDAPIKLALYGTAKKPETLYHTDNGGAELSYYIYGASVLYENRTVEEVGNEYFPAYQFIGYVNVHNNGGESISKYHIFYDDNNAMKDYLLYYHMSPFSTFRYLDNPLGITKELSALMLDNTVAVVKSKKNQKKAGKRALYFGKIKLFILNACGFMV